MDNLSYLLFIQVKNNCKTRIKKLISALNYQIASLIKNYIFTFSKTILISIKDFLNFFYKLKSQVKRQNFYRADVFSNQEIFMSVYDLV